MSSFFADWTSENAAAVPDTGRDKRIHRRRPGLSQRGVFGALAAVLVLGITATFVTASARVSPSIASAPIRAAFYYQWYPQNFHTSNLYAPSLGQYDSANHSVMNAQVSMAKQAGLDAFISSWAAGTNASVALFPRLLDVAAAQSFHAAPYYEPEGNATPPTVAVLKADLDSLYATMSGHPGALTVGGKPVLFVYNTRTEGSCAGVARVLTASAGRFYVNAKVFAGYTSCATQPDSWHQYGPAVGYHQLARYSATVSPGFWKHDEATPRLARNVTRFKADLARQVASGAQWQLVTTWNEWGEGTSVEPSPSWQSPSGLGTYLDAMHDAYSTAASPPPPSSTPLPSSTPPPSSIPPPSSSPPQSSTPPPSSPPPPPGTAVNKVLVFVEENHSLAQMQAGMPYLYSQAKKYGYATHYTAVAHPSLPNYLAMTFGSTFGVTDDGSPSTHPEQSPDVFDSALTHGRTAKSYQESMRSNCQTTRSGHYAVKHNPWAYAANQRANCLAGDVPSGTTTSGALRNDVTAGTLPNVGEVTPNLNDDGHDGSLSAADNWLKGWLTLLYASPDWKSGQLAIIVTGDEDTGSQGNTVLTAVIHPSQSGHIVTTPLTHYSLATLLTTVGDGPCISNGCTAPSMASAFGLQT